ncbi:MAG TPA: DJ-1/PfpI family protein [Acidimicrobiales bacterium]|nr:DJ-1/PfpI family protein [Acidimicrobiales bacterium]
MQIAIGLFPGFTALDAIGPYQVFTQLPDAAVVLCASKKGELADDNGLLRLNIAHTFEEVDAPDILVVPGGFITRRLARDGDPIVDWVRAAHPGTTFTASVCTGALLLGAAGLLDGLDATTHWCAYEELARYGATPTEERVVRRGRVWTAAGVSAGIDLALTLVAETYGDAIAQAIQLGIEYDPQPPFDAGAPSKAPAEIVELVRSRSAAREAEVLGGE